MSDLPAAAQAVTDGSTMPELSKILIVYGPLGILALLLIYVAIRLYRDRDSDRLEFAKALKEEREKSDRERQEFAKALKEERERCDRERLERAKEYNELEERLITKAETWMGQYHELAKSIHQLLESLVKRRS